MPAGREVLRDVTEKEPGGTVSPKLLDVRKLVGQQNEAIPRTAGHGGGCGGGEEDAAAEHEGLGAEEPAQNSGERSRVEARVAAVRAALI